MKALTITPDGTITEVELADNGSIRYDELRATVGGYLEPVRLADDLLIWVDEEGGPHFKGYDRNPTAAIFAMVQLAKVDRVLAGGMMYGTVVVIGNDGAGEDADLPDRIPPIIEQLRRIQAEM